MAASSRFRVRLSGLRCKDLPAADTNGLSDAYAVLSVGKERYETEVVKESLNPMWSSAFEFGLREDLSKFQGIDVVVFDKDFFGKDELGFAHIAFSELLAGAGQTLSISKPLASRRAPGVPVGRFVRPHVCPSVLIANSDAGCYALL